jgi:argininosuccinate synthase
MAEANYEVHTVTVDTGGFSDQELVDIERRAYALGATSHKNIKATSDFYKQCVKYLIFGNVLKNNTYPLCVSAERAFQALMIAKTAQEIGADAIAHGSTGAGNDQIRFDLMFHVLCPDVKIITPIRDKKLSREDEQAYLQKHNIPCSDKTAKYSINQGLWGTSVGGCETLTSLEPLPEEAWPIQMTKSLEDKQKIKITFEKGEPIALNDQAASPVSIIKDLQALAQPYGVGRDIHVGDTIINIKGRVGFEAAAPLILIKAHHTLEKHVLTKAQLKLKDQLANTYGELVHEGQFIEPVLRDIEAYLTSSQKRVCGDVFIELAPWQYQILGCESKFDLMAAEGSSYGENNEGWTADDVKGFSKILSNQLKAYQKLAG